MTCALRAAAEGRNVTLNVARESTCGGQLRCRVSSCTLRQGGGPLLPALPSAMRAACGRALRLVRAQHQALIGTGSSATPGWRGVAAAAAEPAAAPATEPAAAAGADSVSPVMLELSVYK